MSVILRGWNDFYEGWLAGIFAQGIPLDGRKRGYLEGRETGAEAQWDEQLRATLEREIELGHVSVFEIPEIELDETLRAALDGSGL